MYSDILKAGPSMIDNFTQEEKRLIAEEHSKKVKQTKVLMWIGFILPVLTVLNLSKVSSFAIMGSIIIAFVPIVRLIALSGCPFCGYAIPGFWSKYTPYAKICPNCKERIRYD